MVSHHIMMQRVASESGVFESNNPGVSSAIGIEQFSEYELQIFLLRWHGLETTLLDCLAHGVLLHHEGLVDSVVQGVGGFLIPQDGLQYVVLRVLTIGQTQSMDTVLRLKEMDQIIGVFEIDRIMTHRMERYGLGQCMGVGNQHLDCSVFESFQNLGAIVEVDGAIDVLHPVALFRQQVG